MTTCTLIDRQPLFRFSLQLPSKCQKTLKPEAALSYETLESTHEIKQPKAEEASHSASTQLKG
jgi:hypothetical protein